MLLMLALAGTVDRSTAINDRILAGRLSDNPKQP